MTITPDCVREMFKGLENGEGEEGGDAAGADAAPAGEVSSPPGASE